MITRDDVELYVMGQYDGDATALERAIADDAALADALAEASRLELLLREAGAAAAFCAACRDLVTADRCDACGAAVRPGGYVVERVLVANAHGRMYVAHDADGKHVALKELAFVHAPSAAALAAFEREATLLRALDHPSIPRFVASFEEGRGVHLRYYLAQELVVGSSLDRLDEHWYSEAEIVDVGKQVLASLVYLQALSPMVVHRGVKPANLLRRSDGTIALVDFGAAYVQGTTAGSTTIGTFGYMPIEQLAGEVDATTDVYALGMTLVHLLTRQEPWRIAQSRTAINASASLRAFLDRMIAPAPRDRFASAKDALAALAALGEHVAIARRRSRYARPAIAAVATAALAAAGLGAYELKRSHPAAPEITPEPDTTPEPAPMTSPALAPPIGDAPLVSTDPAQLVLELAPKELARLEIDGKLVALPSSHRVSVAPGNHRIVVTLGGGERCTQNVVLAAGDTTKLACVAASPPAQPADALVTVDRPVDAALALFKQGSSAAAVRAQLHAIPATHPDHRYALYWIAVISLRDLADWETARTATTELAAIIDHAPIGTMGTWLGPWTLVREAQIAEHDAHTDEARALWTKAMATAKANQYSDRELEQVFGAASAKYGL
jgi:Protein kinase domain